MKLSWRLVSGRDVPHNGISGSKGSPFKLQELGHHTLRALKKIALRFEHDRIDLLVSPNRALQTGVTVTAPGDPSLVQVQGAAWRRSAS